jgi:hypothetical protein
MKFYEYFINDRLELPPPKKLRNGTIGLPYIFVGDKAFALCQDFLKPFSQNNLNTERRIFNNRLLRARRIVENVFGILISRF